MRLIDVDKLLESLNNSGIEFNANINRIIIEQPTVYDVEKVCEELLIKYQQYDSIFDSSIDLYYLGKSHAYREAIDIVKRGGVDG